VTTSIKSEKLRDSGLGWVGQVPIHWAIVPTRAVLKLHRELVGDSWVDRQLLSLTKRGIVVRDIDSGHGKYPSSFDTYQVVRSGNLVFCLFEVDETPRTVGLSDLDGMVTGAYDCFVTSSNLNERFAIWYYIAIDDGKRFRPLYSGLRKVIAKPRFLSAGFALPPLDEQRQIAEYLDRETGKIDLLITKQEQLVATLTERRQAVIVHSTTYGLDEAAAHVHSSVPWLGSVPSHWTVASIKRYASTGAGSGFPHEHQGQHSESVPFLKVNALSRADPRGLITTRDDTVSRETAADLGAKIYPEGTTIMAKIGAALLLGRVRSLGEASCIDNNLMAIAPRSGSTSRYLYWALHLVKFDWLVNPGAVPSTSEGAVGRYVLAFPPLLEQQQIAQYLDEVTEQIDHVRAEANAMIQLLRERRAALISAAVTGKIDLRSPRHEGALS